MAREWNSAWDAIFWPENMNPVYHAQMQRMILASIEWVEANPEADLKFEVRDLKQFMKASGIPDEVNQEEVNVIAPWSWYFRAGNDETGEWFKLIIERGLIGLTEDHEPTVSMMKKAMAAGMLVMQTGFESYNRFMCTAAADTSIVN